MKCQSNKIGEWLDGIRWSIVGSCDCSYYNGAVDALKTAGFNVDTIPCGKSVIHIVKSNKEE